MLLHASKNEKIPKLFGQVPGETALFAWCLWWFWVEETKKATLFWLNTETINCEDCVMWLADFKSLDRRCAFFGNSRIWKNHGSGFKMFFPVPTCLGRISFYYFAYLQSPEVRLLKESLLNNLVVGEEIRPFVFRKKLSFPPPLKQTTILHLKKWTSPKKKT